MDTTFTGQDEAFGYDETKSYDLASDASLFIFDWFQPVEYELLYSGLTDVEVSSFISGDKIFFLTGNEIVWYDGTTTGTLESIAYVPIVSMGKNPSGTLGTSNEKFNHLSNKWKESYSPDGAATEFQLTKQYDKDGVTLLTLSTNPFKAWISGVEKNEEVDFTVDRDNWKVTFSVAPILGTDSVVIQAEADNLMDPTVITHCTRAIEYGGKNNSHVMLTGNKSFPNTIRYNIAYDPTYWPEDNDFNVGGDARSISGWGRMNEYLITYKEPGDGFAQWYSEIDIDSDGNISFPTFGLNDEFGCIAPKTVHSAQNGLLALSDKGVVWTWASLIKGQANCKVVSHNINGKNKINKGLLDNTTADLKNAYAEVHNNKYLLHVKDRVWVLDLDYSDLANGVYCWYPYTGLYGTAILYGKLDTQLYIGDSSGNIYNERLADDDYPYQDGESAIDAWWTSPLMFLGGREWEKKFERISMTFKPTHGTNHTLSLISDMGIEDIPLLQESGFFDARYFHAEYLNAGTNNPNYPSTQSEKIGYKGEYMQFRIRNNMINRGLIILAASINFSLRKRVK